MGNNSRRKRRSQSAPPPRRTQRARGAKQQRLHDTSRKQSRQRHDLARMANDESFDALRQLAKDTQERSGEHGGHTERRGSLTRLNGAATAAAVVTPVALCQTPHPENPLSNAELSAVIGAMDSLSPITQRDNRTTATAAAGATTRALGTSSAFSTSASPHATISSSNRNLGYGASACVAVSAATASLAAAAGARTTVSPSGRSVVTRSAASLGPVDLVDSLEKLGSLGSSR
eukprot:scpid79897/ scgid33360/ 